MGTTTLPYGITSSPYIATDYLIYCNLQYGNCTYSYANPSFWLPGNAGVSCVNLLTQWFYYGYTSTETLPDTYNVFCNPWSYFYIVYVYNVTTIKDYTVFNQDALSISEILGQTMDDGKITSESIAAEIIEAIWIKIFGTEIIGGVLGDDTLILEGEEGSSQEDRDSDRLDAIILDIGISNKHNKTDEDIDQECYADAWGNNPISQYVHYYSRKIQQWNLTLDQVNNVYAGQFKNYGPTATHNIGTSGNQDYRGEWNNGYGAFIGWQLIFDSNGDIVDENYDPRNMGTYDFAPPSIKQNLHSKHVQLDITPWLEWGNSPYPIDYTTREQRLGALFEECLRQDPFTLICTVNFYLLYHCLYE